MRVTYRKRYVRVVVPEVSLMERAVAVDVTGPTLVVLSLEFGFSS